MVVCKILVTEDEISSLSGQWHDLHVRTGLSPFTDYDWAMIWWRAIAKPEGAGLMVAACFEDERLVGLVPFSIRLKYGVRVLRLIGHEVFYYRNFLFEDPAYIEPLWLAVMSSRHYDCAQIKNIHEHTPERAFFDVKAMKREETHVHSLFHEGKTEATLFADRSSSTRRHFKNISKTVKATPGLSYHAVETGPVPEDVMDFLLTRKKEWTVEKGKDGIFSEPHCNDFYKQVADYGAAHNAFYLNWLVYHDKIVAAALNFTCRDTVYFHTGTYDPAVSSFKPGLYLCLQTSVWGAAKGFVETNYMEGEEDYKKRFSRQSRVICEYVFASTLKGRVFLGLLRAQSVYRRWRSSSTPHSEE